jgi:hypothetical protein
LGRLGSRHYFEIIGEPITMSAFAPVSDAQLAQARRDPQFRQRLLKQSLELLLARLQKLRAKPATADTNAKQIREGVQLAVRLAELIQADPGRSRGA